MKIAIGLPFDLENPEHGGFIHSYNSIKKALSNHQLTIYAPKGGDIKLKASQKNESSLEEKRKHTLALSKEFAEKVNHTKDNRILCFTDMGLYLERDFVSFTSNVPSKKAANLLKREYPSESKYEKIINEFEIIAKNELLSYKKAKRIIVLSEKIKQDLISEYNIEEEKIKYIPRPIPNLYSDLKKLETNGKSMKVILMPSELRVRKGIKYAIETMKILKKEVPSAVLLICGKINPFEEDYIKELLEDSKGKANIILAGYVQKEKLYEYMKNSECAFMPFLFDECPIALSECLGHNLPIVTNEYCGYKKEIIEKFGFCCEHNNIEDYASKLISLLKEEEVNTEKRENITKIKKELNFDSFKEELNNVFKEI